MTAIPELSTYTPTPLFAEALTNWKTLPVGTPILLSAHNKIEKFS